MNEYNDVINILNNATSKYLNITYAESVRSVGSVPNNPSYDEAGMFMDKYFTSGYSGKLKDTDTNYTTDWNQMKVLNIHNIAEDYWLASRTVSAGVSANTFRVRYMWGRGDNLPIGAGLCEPRTNDDYSYSNTYGLRPVFHLKSGIKVTGGNGSSDSPYTLST